MTDRAGKRTDAADRRMDPVKPRAREAEGSVTGTTARFARKTDAVISAATHIMNNRGLRGMTFVDVADMVGLNTSSVTYYFRRKEHLAAAVFERTLERIETLVDEAEKEETPRARVAKYVSLNFELHRRIHRGDEQPIAVLSEMRSLEDSVRRPLGDHYSSIFRRIRDFFGATDQAWGKALNTARAQVLTENMYWLPVWLFHYSYSDFDRVQHRMLDLFDKGLALPDAPWDPQCVALDRGAGMSRGHASFLKAATRLVSEFGYRGASVEAIAAELNVTKGSFYHYLEAKEALVLDCFRNSYGAMGTVLAAEWDQGQWQRLTSVVATLLDIQFDGDWPLLRTTAMQTLPPHVREGVVSRAARMALTLAGTITDGICDDAIRPVDPLIAAQAIMSGLNAAYELRNWSHRFDDREQAVRVYASTLLYGLFSEPPQ
ncbi:TetR/AcrR family transcriptional regulator [Sphingobium subterraneum]|uniref:AcrR family transcriptional regulator n=1 Tax=Sphingobium subterraneum TaxID=627688 RepID=A0A841IY79_9SPHN|nr:TetR family transcriptional regulator [Sphingobium subterraneum]MBB6123613.1 AcrR family transcriptional regulator [Sphingobium subterraneum]